VVWDAIWRLADDWKMAMRSNANWRVHGGKNFYFGVGSICRNGISYVAHTYSNASNQFYAILYAINQSPWLYAIYHTCAQVTSILWRSHIRFNQASPSNPNLNEDLWIRSEFERYVIIIQTNGISCQEQSRWLYDSKEICSNAIYSVVASEGATPLRTRDLRCGLHVRVGMLS